MSEVAYLDQNTLLGRCYQTKSYAFLREKILGERDVYTKVLHADGEVYGYTITLNEPLTELYDFSCYVVKFVFSKVDTLHSSNQEKIMLELCVSLKNDMEAVKGYYTMRVPAHIVDLIRAINQTFTNLIFCGGTVDVVFSGPLSMQKWDKDIEVFIADQSFIKKNKDQLVTMAFESFKRYQGQYHISSVTDDRASRIYSQWIERDLEGNDENIILVAQHNREIAGYLTAIESSMAIEGILASVNGAKRSLGIYKAMNYSIIQYAESKEKLYVTGTQFDNFITQKTYYSMGLRPFYSIYNMHLDNR